MSVVKWEMHCSQGVMFGMCIIMTAGIREPGELGYINKAQASHLYEASTGERPWFFIKAWNTCSNYIRTPIVCSPVPSSDVRDNQ